MTEISQEIYQIIENDVLFCLNDEMTRAHVAATIRGYMERLQCTRTIYDYCVTCDDSNNTAATIDANSLIVDVAYLPRLAAAVVYVNCIIAPGFYSPEPDYLGITRDIVMSSKPSMLE